MDELNTKIQEVIEHLPPTMKVNTSFADNIKNMGFVPEYYSINAPFINQEPLDQCHQLKTELIIGNCNDYKEVLRLGKLGVHSVISDFPLQWSSK